MYLSNSSTTNPPSHFKRTHEESCSQCVHMSKYCGKALHSSRTHSFVRCDSDLFQLVELSIQLIQYHAEHTCSWIPALLHELFELSKQIKEESAEVDRLTLLEEEESTEEDGWDRAIRISIYYCRASLYEQQNMQRALEYYRKCLCVRPSKHTNLVQRSARLALEQLGQSHIRPYFPSRTSSVSSKGSAAHKSCSNCGREKRGMPVCSQCKSQYYCTVRCLKEHKPIHALECHAFK
ncbi:unnamed protein product [Rhizopus stolonifer]